MTDFNFILADDYIKTLEAWPIAGTMELDYVLVSRIHRFIIDPLMARPFKVRALQQMRQVMDKPCRAYWRDVQDYIDNCQDA